MGRSELTTQSKGWRVTESHPGPPSCHPPLSPLRSFLHMHVFSILLSLETTFPNVSNDFAAAELVCQGRHNETPQREWLKQQKCAHISVLKNEVLAGLVPPRSRLLGVQTATLPLCLHALPCAHTPPVSLFVSKFPLLTRTQVRPDSVPPPKGS